MVLGLLVSNRVNGCPMSLYRIAHPEKQSEWGRSANSTATPSYKVPGRLRLINTCLSAKASRSFTNGHVYCMGTVLRDNR